jgi:DNA-3-methyladenine glycosylase II
MTSTHCSIALPAGFRAEDILEFHRRDPQAFAERVAPGRLQKGLVVDGKAACLSLAFHPAHVDAELAIDSRSTAANEAALTRLVCRMLGLTQRIEIFEQDYRQHPQLGPLIARQSGLRVPLAATPFEALTWAITGQQISVGAAVSMRRKLIKAAGQTHSSGLACYPDAAQLAQLTEADLRAAGFSANKAQTLITVSAKVLSGELPLDAWQENLPVDMLRERLLDIRGIGPWTVNYTLLRGFGWLDGSLHGDVAVRHGMQILLDSPDKISEKAAQQWLAEFSPWRALLAAHLWAMKSLAA